ncbi:alpha/beta hydrolase [Tepiditoga spiralis]|uniref:Alpha/beta hydrolase n=1 Tax=Tepiditoga spiralis TaxID=2108365 RepID=A0A7G1G201_9BACT|nr:alpha/beta hydrolase [Tepiditoga spiralis]BBE29865.1 alpha/beta hydrolase [Tepiditoga spiralis]
MAFKNFTNIKQFDFQINRILTYGEKACNEKEVYEAAKEIKDMKSWFKVWNKLGKIAEHEKRYLHAAFYYRLAEFFLIEKDVNKEKMYNLSIHNFNKVIDNDKNVKKFFVPYKNSQMKTLVFNSKIEKGKIIAFGGYDSFIEEFYLSIKEISEKGYTVYLFEGPGQGLTLKNGIYFEYNWENSLSAVLNYFNLNDVFVIGISWGGYFSLRAAAFEKRIKKVIAYDILYDGFDCMIHPFPKIFRYLIKFLFFTKQKNILNFILNKAMKKELILNWAIAHGMYITGTNSPYDFYKNLKKHTLKNISKKIKCDVLLLAGEEDHYIPLNHYHILMKKLKYAKNLTGKIFTKAEGGEQHCQVGNHEIAIDYMIDWLES